MPGTYQHQQHRKHKHKRKRKHKKEKYPRRSPQPPVPLPMYSNMNYMIPYLTSCIEPTSTTHTNSYSNRRRSLSESHSSVHSVRSPSSISSPSSVSSISSISSIPSPSARATATAKPKAKQKQKQINYYTKTREKYAPNFYRHHVDVDDTDTGSCNWDSLYEAFDYRNPPHRHMTHSARGKRKKGKGKKGKGKKEKERERERETEREYDYYVSVDSDGDIYIDVSIDLNALALPPQLNVYNILSSPSPSSSSSSIYGELTSHCEGSDAITIEIRERSIQKHESILLEILKSTNRESVLSCIANARCDVLCYFLPLIAFTLCQSDKLQWRLQLLQRLKERIIGQSDLKQSVKFLLKSYDDIAEVRAVFAGAALSQGRNANNATDFWNGIMAMKSKLKEGEDISVPLNTVIRDPINPLRAPIKRVVIRKVINSSCKPLLIDAYSTESIISSTFILKCGDDLRKDKACMLVFKWMNHLWKNKVNLAYKNKYNVRILTYKVIPMSNRFGCIELISNCVPLRDILTLQDTVNNKPDLMNNLIVSAAGSYIASYIMGIRDRHFDNILIRSTDLHLFHIDMNYVLGDTLKGIDANEFGITRKLHDFLNKDNYNVFVNLCCKAFQVLREHNQEFINFSCLAFSYVCDYKTVRSHILKQLRMSQSQIKAQNWLKNTLNKAPFDVQTQIKNKLHKFATR